MGVERAEVERKMRTVLAQFRRELKKIKDSKSGDGAVDVYKTSWFAFDSLSFLNNTTTPHETDEAELQRMGICPPTSDNADICVEGQVTTASGQFGDADTPQGSANVVMERTPSTSGNRKCQKRKYNDDSMVQEAYNVMKTLQNRCNERDEHQAFAEFIAYKLRGLKTQHARSTVQHKIHNILHYAEMGHYDNPAEHNHHCFNTPSPCTSIAPDDGFVPLYDCQSNHGRHITDQQ
ncbi:hypothetical protein SK128_019299 [Halocaridina rubra]|uniref:MADF domain-containing protein n=1 Tax=Halocaridina rubra TaxID=373956 RepID=A0AAN8WU24_HALRR